MGQMKEGVWEFCPNSQVLSTLLLTLLNARASLRPGSNPKASMLFDCCGTCERASGVLLTVHTFSLLAEAMTAAFCSARFCSFVSENCWMTAAMMRLIST